MTIAFVFQGGASLSAGQVGMLRALTEAGILVETTTGPRKRVWRSPEVLAALDAFAERAGQRG